MRPGEWFLSRDGWLYYMPREGEDMRSAEVVAPVVEKFLIFDGDVQERALGRRYYNQEA